MPNYVTPDKDWDLHVSKDTSLFDSSLTDGPGRVISIPGWSRRAILKRLEIYQISGDDNTSGWTSATDAVVMATKVIRHPGKFVSEWEAAAAPPFGSEQYILATFFMQHLGPPSGVWMYDEAMTDSVVTEDETFTNMLHLSMQCIAATGAVGTGNSLDGDATFRIEAWGQSMPDFDRTTGRRFYDRVYYSRNDSTGMWTPWHHKLEEKHAWDITYDRGIEIFQTANDWLYVGCFSEFDNIFFNVSSDNYNTDVNVADDEVLTVEYLSGTGWSAVPSKWDCTDNPRMVGGYSGTGNSIIYNNSAIDVEHKPFRQDGIVHWERPAPWRPEFIPSDEYDTPVDSAFLDRKRYWIRMKVTTPPATPSNLKFNVVRIQPLILGVVT